MQHHAGEFLEIIRASFCRMDALFGSTDGVREIEGTLPSEQTEGKEAAVYTSSFQATLQSTTVNPIITVIYKFDN